MNEQNSDGVWSAIHASDDRITELRADMRETVTKAVQDAMPHSLLTEDEHRWVQLAIKRESQSIAFRQAVIEKTLMGLVWVAVIAIGLVFKDFFIAHGWKP